MSDFPIIKASKKSLEMRKPVFGIGINDVDYQVQPKINGKQIQCPFYRKWTSMLTRCYCPKHQEKYPTYTDCTVCDEWLTFSKFRNWMIKQNWQDMHLDKDILIPGNKIYSPENCLFVTQAINMLLNDSAAVRGDFPQGVCWHKRDEKYQAYCSVNNKKKYLGYHNTVEIAELAYKAFKKELIQSVAKQQTEPLKSALLAHAVLL